MSVVVTVASRERGEVRVALAMVRYDPSASVEALSYPRSVDETFSAFERGLCGSRRVLDSWAGKLAAKRATVEVLGIDERETSLSEIEIVNAAWRPCVSAAKCRMGHPPNARLSRRLRERIGSNPDIEVSLSHDDGYALAAAVRRRA